MNKMAESAHRENMLSATLGQNMRVEGLRKENARAWAEVERLRAAFREICRLDGSKDLTDAYQIANRALIPNGETAITNPDPAGRSGG